MKGRVLENTITTGETTAKGEQGKTAREDNGQTGLTLDIDRKVIGVGEQKCSAF